MYRVLCSVMLAFMLLLTNMSSSGAALEKETKQPVMTSEEYEDFLVERGKVDAEALKVKEQFAKLSPKKKGKFLSYISDPKILEETLTTVVPENSSKELYDGDIVVESKTEKEEIEEAPAEDKSFATAMTAMFYSSCNAAPAIKTIKLSDTKVIKIGSVKVASFTVWVLYKAQGSTVKSVVNGNGYFSNWYPVSIKKNTVSKYVHGNKAQTCIVWQIGPIIVGDLNMSFMSFNRHHDVVGNAQGGKSYRWFKS